MCMEALGMAANTFNLPLPAIRQHRFTAGLLVFFVALSANYSLKVTGKEAGSAIVRWNQQLQEIADGDNPYRETPYPNPPMMALLLIPFAKLPPLAGALCWFYAKVALTLLAYFWVFRIVELPAQPFPEWAKVLVVLLSLRPVMGDLM